jgi:hypothetical protein
VKEERGRHEKRQAKLSQLESFCQYLEVNNEAEDVNPFGRYNQSLVVLSN